MSVDNKIMQMRIIDNITSWENSLKKHNNIKYNPNVAKFIKENELLRLILNKHDGYKNEYKAYVLAKHLINSGRVTPSEIYVVSIEDCYLSIRGFGEREQIKHDLFSYKNKLIIIENMREIRATDVKDNVYSFWEEFWAYLRRNRNINVFLCFEEQETEKNKKDWYPRTLGKAPHKELHFIYN